MYDFLFSVVELKKQISCSFQLSNKTEDHVAFKVNNFLNFPQFCWLIILSKLNLQNNVGHFPPYND